MKGLLYAAGGVAVPDPDAGVPLGLGSRDMSKASPLGMLELAGVLYSAWLSAVLDCCGSDVAREEV